MVANHNLLTGIEVAGFLIAFLGLAYIPGVFPPGKRWPGFFDALPSAVGAGAFGAFIAILMGLDPNPIVLGVAGAASGIIGLFMPRNLSEKAKQPFGIVLVYLGVISAFAAVGVEGGFSFLAH